jgi:hypothetical protein
MKTKRHLPASKPVFVSAGVNSTGRTVFLIFREGYCIARQRKPRAVRSSSEMDAGRRLEL